MKELFLKSLGKWNCLLAVIHVEGVDQSLRNAKIAFENGADGIFLIDHHYRPVSLIVDIYHAVRKEFPERWIGLNFLGVSMWQILENMPADTSGLWCDFAHIDEERDDQLFAEGFFKKLSDGFPNTLYFGGVAFKGQREVGDYGLAAKKAQPYMHVITTSGPSTGIEPYPAKLHAMRDAVGPDQPIANASGTKAGNVHNYQGTANCFIVASGISRPGSFTELEPVLVKELTDTIHSFNEL